VSPAQNPHGVYRRCPVERLCYRSTPVNDEWISLVVINSEAPHIKWPPTDLSIYSAECKGGLPNIKNREPAMRILESDISLKPCLVCTAPTDFVVGLSDSARRPAHTVKARVDAIKEFLLCCKLRIRKAWVFGHVLTLGRFP
jgi:hypothetical protein